MNYNIKAPYYFRVPKALYADSNRIFITICYRRASRPTAIFLFILLSHKFDRLAIARYP